MKKKLLISYSLLAFLILAQFASPQSVYAAGTVGDGTAISCTEAALNAALAGGGAVNFKCGAAPVTITITSTKVISSDTQIDGGGLVTISGGNQVRVFTVNSNIKFDIKGLTIANGHVAGVHGGGMFVGSGATVNITDSTFTSNTIENGYGGAMYVNGATVNIHNSIFANNSVSVLLYGSVALGGGAIQNNDGVLTIEGSTFFGNSVEGPSADGGAIYNGDLDGGEIPDENPDVLSITNSTFYGNRLIGNTTGSSGGAVRSGSRLTISHSTFSDNDSGIASTGGEAGAVTITHGTATLVNNIFANSSAADCAKRSSVTSLTSSGNLIENNYGGLFGCGVPLLSLDPNLGPLQNNNGPTPTMALQPGSPAIDALTTCILAVDQRGATRPISTGGKCDIGAFEVDATAPTATVSQVNGQRDPTNESPIVFAITFSEPVLGFDVTDINLGNSTVGGVLSVAVTGGPSIYTVSVTGMTTPGSVIITLPPNAAHDFAGNGNVSPAGGDDTVEYDATPLTITLNQAPGQLDPTNLSPVNFSVTFSRPVTNFIANDVFLSGTAGAATAIVTGGGAIYNVAVSGMTTAGTVIASIPYGVVSDAAGNTGASASTDNTVNYDGTRPTVTINQASGQPDPAGDPSIEFTVVFSEPVSGFDDSDISLAGQAAATTVAVTGGPTAYSVLVSGMTHHGSVIASVAAGAVMDESGNLSFASTSTDNSVDYIIAIPDAPSGSQPLSGSVMNTTQPLLDWVDASPTPDYYQFQLSYSNDFSSFILDETHLLQSQFMLPASLLPGRTYYWRVRGFNALDDPGEWSAIWSFAIRFSAPGGLIVPTANQHVLSLRPSFDWVDVDAVGSYTIQISRSSNFGQIVVSDTLVQSKFDMQSDLPPNQKLFWRVEARNLDGTRTWSETLSFTTPNPPGVPVLKSPNLNAVVNNYTLIFKWSTASVPRGTTFDHYQIQVASNSAFTTPVIDATVNGWTNTNYVPSVPLGTDTRYYWHVRSVNAGNEASAWSSVWSFVVPPALDTGSRPRVFGLDASLPTPQLASSSPGRVSTGAQPTLEWNDAAGAASYIVQVSADQGFSSLIVSATTVDSSYQILKSLPETSSVLYWRVLMVGESGFSNWSDMGTLILP